jgi:predicted transcriptional regulator
LSRLGLDAVQLQERRDCYVEAKLNRPGEAPMINRCYLSEETDRRAIMGGCLIRFAPHAPMYYNINIVYRYPSTAMSKSVTIAARVDADLDHELERLAEATGRSKSWLINEALRSYVANEQQFLTAVEEGKQALQAGQVVDHATVVAAFERVVKPHP